MSLVYNEKDIALAFSHNKQVKMKVTLLDELYDEVDNLIGRIKTCPFSVSSESDIRRTSTLTLIVDNKADLIEDFEITWIERVVELHCGILDREIGDYVWYPLGRMLMVDGKTTLTSTSLEVSLSLVDLMASLTDGRGSQLGSPVLIEASLEAGITISKAIEVVIAEFSPYKKTKICAIEETLPYDVTAKIGDYPHSLLKTLLNLAPHYEMYYDIDGQFVVEPIATKIDDPYDIEADIIDRALIKEERSVKFSDVKNTIELWGMSLDAMYTAISCVTTEVISDESVLNRYDIMIDDSFDTLVVGETYSFTPTTDSIFGQLLKIQDTKEGPIYSQAGNGSLNPIETGAMQKNIPYVIKYTDGGFVLQGELEIHVIVQEINVKDFNTSSQYISTRNEYKKNNNCRSVKWIVNPDSAYACTLTPTTQMIAREAKKVLEGGEYANIYTTDLAYERAEYELWQRSRLKDAITLEMLLLPWMEVNDKIEYTSPSSGKKIPLLVQAIDYDFTNWTMTVKASKFYPVYPW